MTDLLDRYYTPPDIADRLIALADGPPEFCIDTACGRGSLLLAAERHFGSVGCIGLDRDEPAIRFLRRVRPNWILSRADALLAESLERTTAIQTARRGLLVLNPPFSFEGRKSTRINYLGHSIVCSIAMAHVLVAIARFGSQAGAVAIVPESLVYSRIDQAGRAALARVFDLVVVERLSNSAFRGTRASALMVRLRPKAEMPSILVQPRSIRPTLSAQMVRGGLPVFEAQPSLGPKSLPFLHTTKIESALAARWNELERVVPITRGRVSGSVVLLPRVGTPRVEHAHSIFLRRQVQLSDCVIALRFKTKKEAELGAARIQRSVTELRDAYRGTGAKYVSLERLSEALHAHAGIRVDVGD